MSTGDFRVGDKELKTPYAHSVGDAYAWPYQKDSKQFSMILAGLLCLWVTQVPRCPANFCTNYDRVDTCACAEGEMMAFQSVTT